MDKLKEILALFRKDDRDKFEQYFSRIGNKNAPKKYMRLYNGIVEGRYENDEEAAADLYQSTSLDKRYFNLKYYLFNKLLDYLIVSSDRDRYRTTYGWIQFTCQRDWVRVQYLLKKSQRKLAIYFAERIIYKASKYEFNDLVLLCARELRYHNGFVGNKRDFYYYEKLLTKALKDYHAEQQAEAYAQRVSMEYLRSASPSQSLVQETKSAIYELQEYSKSVSTLHFNRYYLQLQALYYQMQEDFASTLQVANQALAIIDQHPLSRPINKAEWYLRKLECSLDLLDYKTGENASRQFEKLIPEGTNTWFAYAEMFFLLLMYTERYSEAIQFFNKVVSHPRFSFMDEAKLQRFKIAEAYLHFVVRVFDIKNQQIQPIKGKSFKLERFLNDVPIYDKDKRGYNVTILIGHILLLMVRGDYDTIIDRAEALKMYTHRHLRNDRHYRSNCFIKMLLITVKEDFNYYRSKKLGSKYYQKLYKRSKDYQGQVDALEVIPYERLWAFVLGMLKANHTGQWDSTHFETTSSTEITGQ